eukprot:9754995-Heterocapsa_arctica.AAC.1
MICALPVTAFSSPQLRLPRAAPTLCGETEPKWPRITWHNNTTHTPSVHPTCRSSPISKSWILRE